MPITDAMVEAAAAVLLGRVNAPEQEIYAAARAALTAALSQKWEDVGSAPKDGTRFLALHIDGAWVTICFWDQYAHRFTTDDGEPLLVSKWCPLPPIPTQEEG